MAEPTTYILTEGKADDAFFTNLIAARKIGDFFRTLPRPENEPTGVGAFARRLIALKTSREIEKIKSIIIVGDNDGDPAVAFRDIKKQIESVGGYNIPVNPREFSTKNDLPAVSILMLPWDTEQGCLETLCLRGVNKKYEKEMQCSVKISECLAISSWPISKQSKLILRCFLAAVCQSDPNTPLHRAWSTDKGKCEDIFPLDNAAFDSVAEFMRRMAT